MEEEGNATWCMIVYIHIRRNYNNGHIDRKGGQTYEQRYVLNLKEKKKENKKVVMYTKQQTPRSAKNTTRKKDLPAQKWRI